jgi:hypothetical protein
MTKTNMTNEGTDRVRGFARDFCGNEQHIPRDGMNGFYNTARVIQKAIEKKILAGEFPGQPPCVEELEENLDWAPGLDEPKQHFVKKAKSVYITSLKLGSAGQVTPGAVCAAALELASIRLTQETQRLSTKEEIDAYLKNQKDSVKKLPEKEKGYLVTMEGLGEASLEPRRANIIADPISAAPNKRVMIKQRIQRLLALCKDRIKNYFYKPKLDALTAYRFAKHQLPKWKYEKLTKEMISVINRDVELSNL